MWLELSIVIVVLAMAFVYVGKTIIKVLKKVHHEEGICNCTFCSQGRKKGPY